MTITMTTCCIDIEDESATRRAKETDFEDEAAIQGKPWRCDVAADRWIRTDPGESKYRAERLARTKNPKDQRNSRKRIAKGKRNARKRVDGKT